MRQFNFTSGKVPFSGTPIMPKMGKHVKRIVIGAAAAVVIVVFASDATYQIQEQEQAVLTTFGVPKAISETGLHFKIPFIQQVQKVNTTIQGFPIGYTLDNNATVENEGIMITPTTTLSMWISSLSIGSQSRSNTSIHRISRRRY